MKTSIIKTSKLRFNIDHYTVTLYKNYRKTLDVKVGDIIYFKINNTYLVRPVHRDYHLKIPVKAIKSKKLHGKPISLEIIKIFDPSNYKSYNSSLKDASLDIRGFIPRSTKFGKRIHIFPITRSKSLIWYPHGGGVQHLILNNKYTADELGEFLGFFFGDGTTCDSIRSLRLTNYEPSILKKCLQFLTKNGIPKEWFKVQVIYSSPTELTHTVKKRCINYWAHQLNIPNTSIISVTRSKNMRESLQFGSARLCVDNSLLVEIFLHGLLKQTLKSIESGENLHQLYSQGFLRGLFAAEGTIQLNKNNSVIRCGLAFDPHSNELKIYKHLLSRLNIEWKYVHGNELMISKWENITKLHKLQAFKLHSSRHRKFLFGVKNHRFSQSLSM